MTVSKISALSSSPFDHSDVASTPCAFLSEEDWLCLSFLTGIGPSRLSRLYTYLEQLAKGGFDLSESRSELTSPSDSGDLFSELPKCTDQPMTYELLRALKWPEITAREAMSYLEHGQLTEEQHQKRETSLA